MINSLQISIFLQIFSLFKSVETIQILNPIFRYPFDILNLV